MLRSINRAAASLRGEVYAEQPQGRVRFEAMAPFISTSKRSLDGRHDLAVCRVTNAPGGIADPRSIAIICQS